MEKTTQHKRILDYLHEHGSITTRDIYVALNINGATARLSELRRSGYDIRSKYEASPNGASFKVYWLNEEARA